MISIGLPIYERAAYVRGALDSCLQQTFPDYEVLIGDTSQKNILKTVVQDFGSDKFRYFHFPTQTELITKLNYLLHLAKGDWMLILCDDDLLEPDYLQAMEARIRQWPEAALFRCRYRLIDQNGKLLRLDQKSKAFMPPAEFLSRIFLPEKYFFKMNISGILFARKLLLRMGGFPKAPVPWHTDRLTWARLAAEGGCVFEEEPLCSIRLHSASLTSRFNLDYLSSLESDLASQKLFEKIIDTATQRARSAEDHEYLLQARKNLNIYMERQLSRSFDHAFMAQLSEPRTNCFKILPSLFQTMEALRIHAFPSTAIYRVLGCLPFGLREPLVRAFKEYKVRKWCV